MIPDLGPFIRFLIVFACIGAAAIVVLLLTLPFGIWWLIAHFHVVIR